MEITEVKVFPIQEEKLKAFVSIVFDQCFMVNDIKIIQGRDGLFISMPSRKKKNGEFKDVAHPLNNETRRTIEDKILVEYERVLGERGEQLPVPAHQARTAGTQEVGGRPLAAVAPLAAAAPLDAAAPLAALEAAATPAHAGGTPPVSPEQVSPSPVSPPSEKTLEEIEEMHLRDSFWTVT
jgi:stage V sporulation protein G